MRGGEMPRTCTENERFGDRIAGQPVGTVGPPSGLTTSKQTWNTRFQVLVHAYSAHVIVGYWSHLDELLGQIDTIGGEPVDDRPESAAYLFRWRMTKAEIGAS